MPDITDECTFKLQMKKEKGQETLEGEIFYHGERIGTINWCGGCSQKKGFAIRRERTDIKVYKEG